MTPTPPGTTTRSAELAEVARAAAGDTFAFQGLYRRHLPRVHRVARWLLGHDDVDDAVQEVFVRAWRKLGSFRGRASFGTWLHRLAVNVILRHRKRTSRIREDGDQSLAALHAPASTSAADAIDLESAVSRLPPRARTVFVLYDVQGLSHLEIAARLVISPRTSRTQLHRARMLLRQSLRTENR